MYENKDLIKEDFDNEYPGEFRTAILKGEFNYYL